MVSRTIMILAAVVVLCGCGNLESVADITGVGAEEVAEAAPIVAANPTKAGVLTAIVSVVSGVAGAVFGAAGMRSHAKRKIVRGGLGVHAKKVLDEKPPF